MLRRNFLQLLGVSPVAAPALAQNALSAPSPLSYSQVTNAFSSFDTSLPEPMSGGVSHKDWLARQIADLRASLSQNHKIVTPIHDVHRLDPDLMVAKSFSLGRRLREQAARDTVRNRANQKNYIEKRIDELLGMESAS